MKNNDQCDCDNDINNDVNNKKECKICENNEAPYVIHQNINTQNNINPKTTEQNNINPKTTEQNNINSKTTEQNNINSKTTEQNNIQHNMNKSSYSILETVKYFIKQNKPYLYKYIFLSIAAPIAEVALPHYYGKVIDNLSTHSSTEAFSCNKTNIKIILGLWVTVQIMQTALDYTDAKFIPILTAYFRDDMVHKILKYYEERSDDPNIGDLLSKIIRLPTILKDLFHQIRIYVMPTVMILISATAYMFYVDFNLGVLMTTGLVCFGLILYKFIKNSVIKVEETTREFDNLHEDIIDILSNTTNIHSNNMIKKELIKLSEKQESFGKSLQEGLECVAKFKRIFAAAYFAIFTTISGYTMKLYSKGKIDIAKASSVLIILLFCIINLTDVSGGIREFIFNVSGLLGLQDYMDQIFKNQEELDKNSNNNNTEIAKHIAPAEILNKSILVQNITIKVGDKQKVIIENFSAEFYSKMCNILIGNVGSGKSTLIKAIMKMKSLSNGNIFVAGYNIKEIECKDLRIHISYVQQNPNLFNRSILENISYGTNKIKEDIINILGKYNITEINNNDLLRSAGKNGNNLSGGQKQMVLIIRFLLKNSPIVILDEPTSNLSPESKNKMIQLLRMLNDGTRTMIIITHDEEVMKLGNNIVSIPTHR